MSLCKDLIKSRVIHFRNDSAEDVAQKAVDLLTAVDGVSRARVRDNYSLFIRYDVRRLSLQMIENALSDVGFELSGNPICLIKRELVAYCEDNLRENLGVNETATESDHTISNDNTPHDPRPYHWRNYF